MIYLASPYSHEDHSVEIERYFAACRAVEQLVHQRNVVFSPIAYCHPIRTATDVPGDAAYWWDFNKIFLEASTSLIILTLDGWSLSTGVAREIGFCAARGIEPEFMEPV